MTAVIYARYSSDSQREASIEGQLRDCKDYAERNGITVVGTYIDRAYSAKTDDRPEFQRMVQDSARKIFDAVLVWKLDRFARNRYDAVFYKRQLEKSGVHLVSVMEPISDGPEGIMVESLLIGMAEYYSAELAIKVARGERENALKCKYNGGVVPLGYVIGKEDRLYHIDPETAPIVQEIFTRYADGEPAEKIASSLNERGLRTRTGKPFVKNSFFQIFKNRRYIGGVQLQGHCDPRWRARHCGPGAVRPGAGTLRQKQDHPWPPGQRGDQLPSDHQTVLRQVRHPDGRRERHQPHGHHLSLL